MLPRSFRGEDPAGEIGVNELPVYQPPSMLAEYKWLAVAFVILLILFATYCYRLNLKPPQFPSAAAQAAKNPVYVTPLLVAPSGEATPNQSDVSTNP